MNKIYSLLFGYVMTFIFVVCAVTPLVHAQEADDDDLREVLFKASGYATMSPSQRAELLLFSNDDRLNYISDNVLFLKDISALYNITFNPADYSIDSIELFSSPNIARYYYNLALSSNRDYRVVFDTVTLPEDVLVDVYFSIHDSSKCFTDEANSVQCPLTNGMLLNILNAYYSCTPAQRMVFYDTFCNPNTNSEVSQLFNSRVNYSLPLADGVVLPFSFSDDVTLVDLNYIDDSDGSLYAYRYGALPGVFTINANGDKVHFSKGNLQFRAIDTTWRFAETQYDLIGRSNSAASATNQNWIDLFGWGTGDINSAYPPYTTDATATYGPSDGRDIAGATNDWGYNAIINGGNEQGKWQTLTQREWDYICLQREGYRFVKSIVNGVHGLILFPDGYSNATLSYSFSDVNNGDAAYATNTISLSDWLLMDSVGCVFLPAAGYRPGANTLFYSDSTIANEYIIGRYWSTIEDSSDGSKAYYVSITNGSFNAANVSTNKSYGLSVRPVYIVSAQQEDGMQRPLGTVLDENGSNVNVNGNTSSDGTVTDDSTTPRRE